MPNTVKLYGHYAFEMHNQLVSRNPAINHSEILGAKHKFSYHAPSGEPKDLHLFKIMLLLNTVLVQLQLNIPDLHAQKHKLEFKPRGKIVLDLGDEYFYFDVSKYEDFALAVQQCNLSIYGSKDNPFDDNPLLQKVYGSSAEPICSVNGKIGFSGSYEMDGFKSWTSVTQSITLDDKTKTGHALNARDLNLLRALLQRATILAAKCCYFYQDDDNWPGYVHFLNFAPNAFTIQLQASKQELSIDSFDELRSLERFITNQASDLRMPLLGAPQSLRFSRTDASSKPGSETNPQTETRTLSNYLRSLCC